MKYSIDRIEENLAVLVDGTGGTINMPLDRFSFEPCEGMVISVGKRCVRRLKAEETQKKKNLNNELKKLLAKK